MNLRQRIQQRDLVPDYLDVALTSEQLLAASDQTIEIAGRKLRPNKTRGYVEFRLGHAFPVVTSYRTAIHAGTLDNSWETIQDQNFNYGHLVARYYKGTDDEARKKEDRIIGAIVAVEPPQKPMGGWRVTSADKAPGLRCAAAIFKQAKGVDKILGQHLTDRHEWTVSMELDYQLADSGVALLPRSDTEPDLPEAEADLIDSYTPEDFRAAGYGYLPLTRAPEGLIDCFSEKEGIWNKPFYGYDVVTMIGGLDGQIHFKGAGIVQYGAEPTAEIDQVLASAHPRDAAILASIQRMSEKLDQISARLRG